MFSRFLRRNSSGNQKGIDNYRRRIRYERIENRCMLSASADIVFLVDESGSEQNTKTQDWLAATIVELQAALAAASIDARFGLIGFGETDNNGTDDRTDDVTRFAHTQLLGPTGGKDQWTASSIDVVSAINSDLAEFGYRRTEDGWDAIEHVVAEYNFREGAVPILILVQGDQGRVALNDTLTHTGIAAAINSKNVILNSIVAGQLLADGQVFTNFVGEPLVFLTGPNENDPPLNPQPEASWAPLFDLARYEQAGSNRMDELYILGVEADQADQLRDGLHDYHCVDTNPSTSSSPYYTFADALQVSYNGSNTGGAGMVGSGKSLLLGPNVTGGVGNVQGAGYRFRGEPLMPIDMTGAIEVFPG